MLPKEKYYIKVGKAADLKSPRERLLYRAFEILPGALAWGTLLAVFFLSWLWPIWLALFIIIFDFYWFIRALHFSFHLVMSYLKTRKHLKIDWLREIANLNQGQPLEGNPQMTALEDIYHLVILPMYKEGLEIANGSFEALVKSDYPKEKMIVVLATEERAGQVAQKTAQAIEKKFGHKFYRFLITCHPQNIVGEIAGKGSNETWAGRQIREKIIDPLKIPYENIIVSCLDIDTQVYPKYFSCLTYHYLTCSNPTRSSFQPIPLYNNNIWQAPIFSRIVATCNVFWQMMQQERPEKLVTYSSHAMSFKALVEMDFWQTNVVSEDAGIFWKAYLFYDGQYQIIPLFYPVSMDACLAESLWRTAINQYKQQRRWAWGVEGIPYLLFGFFKNIFSAGPKIPWTKKFRYSILLLGGFWAWAVTAFIILFLGWLPLILGGQKFNTTILSYNLPQLTSRIMTLAMIGILISAIVSSLLLPPRPAQFGFRRSLPRTFRGLRFAQKLFYHRKVRGLFMFLQWVLLPATLIIFGAIPAIDAQTRLMLGKYMGFWVTEKKR
ncbi:MAG: hypothetical protein A3I88_01695 [Candidatus Portnoybacteria bacterium RIFCSPLOWO2_12_FULL_39_9]|uniref:Glycosyltransferase 2-like domain-containing protein n=1 Tax=Candidatus Portnoybacteria bacterium RIFCSPHIGHO2_12_FULL_38_9 TaxID=1801997 RepID=A0A1G2FGZ3_9BACT|nr:MAG: hypothetical protein A3J64_02005 [Candidatus Portnoybacteria bacterium RIFCSPHIGHO2_12_FULL_38_9]OGZ39920.1 MAG: hypothetical protein A3I88_01695 [Candidatus Portnoybacteria bacterium RIFCSPLOWO2_12_FULL_39_9]